MKLELGCVQINDIQFASESKVENGTIYAVSYTHLTLPTILLV